MASTYTSNLGVEKIGAGEQAGAWGTTTNNNFDIIDIILIMHIMITTCSFQAPRHAIYIKT